MSSVAMVSGIDQLALDEASDGADTWTAIRDPARRLWLEARPSPVTDATVARLLASAPQEISFAGPLADLPAALADQPSNLAADVIMLAGRFARLMNVSAVRVRIETLMHDACTRVHADYTDLRLITTYAGPGTDYVEGDDRDAPPHRMPAGWVGLFKGHGFAPGHAPCFHRSPPIAATGQRRLMLVIDTPARAGD